MGILTAAVTAAAGAIGGAGISAGVAGAAASAAAGANASGTDDWRGGPTWVGEQGPEILNLPRGSQVTPNDVATRGGGDTYHQYDMRGAVVTDDLLRKAEGANMMAAGKRQAVYEAIAHMSARGIAARLA